MTAPAAVFDWQVGCLRAFVPGTVYGVASAAAVMIAIDWTVAWLYVGVIGLLWMHESAQWIRQRGRRRTLTLTPNGVAIDAHTYRARRAWLGPGWTAVWLQAGDGRCRWAHFVRDELTADAQAALRRHVESLEYL
jgi:hypothetical protein